MVDSISCKQIGLKLPWLNLAEKSDNFFTKSLFFFTISFFHKTVLKLSIYCPISTLKLTDFWWLIKLVGCRLVSFQRLSVMNPMCESQGLKLIENRQVYVSLPFISYGELNPENEPLTFNLCTCIPDPAIDQMRAPVWVSLGSLWQAIVR